MREYWLLLEINPVSWAVGPLQVVRRNGGKMGAQMGRNQGLAAYQQAVREEVSDQLQESGWTGEVIFAGPVELELFFWHSLDEYQGATKRVVKNKQDVTNMQKATEDALTGIFYADDRDNLKVSSTLCERRSDGNGAVLIHVTGTLPDDGRSELPAHVPPDVRGDVATMHLRWATAGAVTIAPPMADYNDEDF